MTAGRPGRIVFDISSLARWTGPPVGIVRAQRELALWAREYRPDAAFVFFDPSIMGYRAVRPRFVDAFITGAASFNGWSLPDPTGRRKRRSAWVPRGAYALLQGRRTLLRRLEHLRLTSERAGLRDWADRTQRRLITDRYRLAMINPDGSRRDFVTADLALGDPVALGPGDTLVCAGFGWSHGNIDAIAAAKARDGFRLAVLCYDIIPLQHPEWFKDRDVADLSRYWRGAFAIADLIVANSHAVRRDVAACCHDWGIGGPCVAVSPLGAEPATLRTAPDASLPAGLKENGYALFVSTIEPRKQHDLLYRVWLRLLAEGVPQAAAFRLVFVGRPGWMMESFERTLREDARLGDSLVVLPRVSDEMLDLIYRRSAFCLYPSLYEGYGLPVVEAFARGKAVLASDGGALPEVVNGLSPVVGVGDEDAWLEMMRNWIQRPDARSPFEAAIRERFRHPSWPQAAAAFFAAVEGAATPGHA